MDTTTAVYHTEAWAITRKKLTLTAVATNE